MENNNITFFDYLGSKNLESSDNASLIRLYKMYVLVEKIITKDPMNASKILEQYEENVYTIGDKKIPKIKRIELEINKISKRISIGVNNNISQTKSRQLQEEIENLKDMLKQVGESEIDESLLEYMKKRISVMQATLGLNNTFLKETHDVFLENYRNLNIKTDISDNDFDESYDDNFNQKIKK